jgi:hypothetical protein
MSKDDLSDFVSTSSKKGPWRRGTGQIVRGIAWSLSLALLLFAVPRFELVFLDFGVDLPRMTKVWIKASHFAVKFVVVLVPLLVGLMVLDDRVSSSLSRKGEVGKSLAWSVVMLVVPLVVLALALLGLVLPLFTPMSPLSGRAPAN